MISPLNVLGSANIGGGCSRNSRGFLAPCEILEPVRVMPLRDATSRPDLSSLQSSNLVNATNFGLYPGPWLPKSSEPLRRDCATCSPPCSFHRAE